MARAAVKAKAKAKQQAAAPRRQAAKRRGRGHSGGGNQNQQLFFQRMRRRARWIYLALAVLFALTFAGLGVGSGSNSGLDQLFSGLNIFSGGGGSSVSKAQKEVTKHPNAPKGYRDLANAYEGKGDVGSAITALQGLTRVKPKDASAWTELAGLQASQAQTYLAQYQAAYQNRQVVAPSSAFLPTSGKLTTALGTNKVEQARAQVVDTEVQNLQSQTQLAYDNAVSSYDQVTQITPKDSEAWFNLATAAQQSGNYTQAVKAYKQYLKLNPNSSNKAQIEQLIKQLSPTASSPAKKKKK